MIKLANVKLVEVIPPSIAVDAKMRAIADAVDVELNKQPGLIKSIALWAQLGGLPSSVLDHLAWQFNVPVWRDSWPQTTKVNVLRTAIRDKSVVGTRGAVERAVQSLGSAVQIVEWFEASPIADPYTFEIIIDLNSIPGQADVETQDDLRRAVDAAKPARSHYRVILSLKLAGLFGMYATGRPAVVSVLRGKSKESFDPMVLSPLGWWDLLDASTLYIDAAGTTPSAAVGDPIGLVRNKGVAGVTGDASQTVSANRPTRTADGIQLDGSTAAGLRTLMQGLAYPVEVWVVVHRISGNHAYAAGNRGAGASQQGVAVYQFNDNSVSAQVRDTVAGVISLAVVDSSVRVPTQIIRAEFERDLMSIQGNGTKKSIAVSPMLSTTVQGGVFGFGWGGLGVYEIKESFIFDRKLSLGEAGNLRAYLEAKHGI